MTLSVNNLSYTYNRGLPTECCALRDISFELSGGCVLSILGHTGSGKSTLAQHLNALITAQSGSVAVDGIDPAGGADARRSVSSIRNSRYSQTASPKRYPLRRKTGERTKMK